MGKPREQRVRDGLHHGWLPKRRPNTALQVAVIILPTKRGTCEPQAAPSKRIVPVGFWGWECLTQKF